MNKTRLLALTTGLIAAACAGGVLAQEEQADNPPMQVVEGWTCSYVDGKGPADLAKANAAWNEWMDKSGQKDYFAATISPYFFAEYNFDVGWLGVAKDGDTFGAGTELWVTEGSDVGAKFMEVVTCDSHGAWVSMMVDTPDSEDSDPSDNDFVASFSNCSIKDGHTFDEYLKAAQEWDAYAKEHGIMGIGWVWFPVAGDTDDYDFKFVSAEDNYIEMGANWQKFMDGHWRKSSELFDDIVDCDSPRIYNGNVIRRMADN